jgi:A/G-specific adenine glycosylase
MEKKAIDSLKSWFIENKRALPWREAPSPYAVWVSEVMLQQTQVAVVLGYFEKWMSRFPTISSLASAPLEEVIKTWEGLGYYSRARHLHEGAQYILRYHDGELPSTREELEKIKGLGPYTIGAILSFAFHQKAPAVDANVMRVLARYFLIEEEILKSSTQKHLRQLTEDLLPNIEPWLVMEAVIELGACVCTPSPKCFSCPLINTCKAHLDGKAALLPIKRPSARTEKLLRSVAVIFYKNEILLQKAERGKVMADLYQFPYFEVKKQPRAASFKKKLAEHFEQIFQLERELLPVKHGFTKFEATLYPYVWKVEKKAQFTDYHWVSLEKIHTLPFSSGHRRILKQL